MFNIVLLEPEIPSNTGNIGRTCLAAGCRLHLIGPLGFLLNDKQLKRAGMDYWSELDVTRYDSWRDFVQKRADQIRFAPETLEAAGCPSLPETSDREKAAIWMATTKSRMCYDKAAFREGDYILFGKESAGIPEELLMQNRESCIRIPMAAEKRSLNLANSAAVILYEALRQNGFPDLCLEGQLHEHRW
ncbi:MAG: tRNA (cytidine(34)-2'-O)-methyltransferase [Parasporobacterium sp.]|nr:tRNA (cytidine(34)-2'-O)-methyltransferase [Parasporobacterium sp.]